jgi:nuclear receptor subfamily 6 group A
MLLTLGQEQQQQHLQTAVPSSSRPPQFPPPLNMERLWAGDLTQLPVSQQQQIQALNLTSASASASGGSPIAWTHRNGGNGEQKLLPPGVTVLGAEHHQMSHPQEEQEEEEQPMICMICEDKATGLHYGIITCEG